MYEWAEMLIFSSCWFDSPEEAGRYLETYKSYEKKPADILKEQVEKNYLSKVAGLKKKSSKQFIFIIWWRC